MQDLTSRQLEILQFLDHYTRAYRCPPTHREMAEHFGWASPQASLGHMRALTRKQCVTPIHSANGLTRGYRLTPRGRKRLLHRRSA